MALTEIRNDDHWHTLRRKHVGSTEAACLFGVHRNKSAFELFHYKKDALPEPDFEGNDRVFWGSILEPAIAAGVAQKHNWDVEPFKVYGTNDNCPGMGASFDFKITRHDKRQGQGLLEIKTCDYLEWRKWDGEPPLAYQLQVQQELACSGFDWAYLALLVGGNTLQMFEYDRRPTTIAKLEEAVTAFWQRIADNDPPPVDFLDDADVISHLYRDAGAGWANFTGNNFVAKLCKEYHDAQTIESAAIKRKKAAKAELLTLIGTSDKVTCEDWTISAAVTEDAHVEAYTRKGYRAFRVTLKRAERDDQS